MEELPSLKVYHLFLRLEDRVFALPKQSQKSRSISQDGSRSVGLCWKGKNRITAKFHRIDLVIAVILERGIPFL